MQLRELFDEFPLGGHDVIPIALQQLLNEPLNVTQDWGRAESLLLQAIDTMPHRLEPRVGLYKLLAYSNRFEEALTLINDVLHLAATQAGFTADWQYLTKHSAQWQNASGPVRFYLYSLKARGFVLLRKGCVKEALEVLKKLQDIDPADQVGGSVVMEIAERVLESELDSVV